MLDDAYTVPRQTPHQVRDERLKIASELLALNIHETALLPVAQQEKLRIAMRCLTDVQTWCRHHQGGDGR
jgi:hypothetical protein